VCTADRQARLYYHALGIGVAPTNHCCLIGTTLAAGTCLGPLLSSYEAAPPGNDTAKDSCRLLFNKPNTCLKVRGGGGVGLMMMLLWMMMMTIVMIMMMMVMMIRTLTTTTMMMMMMIMMMMMTLTLWWMSCQAVLGWPCIWLASAASLGPRVLCFMVLVYGFNIFSKAGYG
jgi:hypothetical protein